MWILYTYYIQVRINSPRALLLFKIYLISSQIEMATYHSDIRFGTWSQDECIQEDKKQRRILCISRHVVSCVINCKNILKKKSIFLNPNNFYAFKVNNMIRDINKKRKYFQWSGWLSRRIAVLFLYVNVSAISVSHYHREKHSILLKKFRILYAVKLIMHAIQN